MHAFDAIDVLELVTVTGGADGDPPATPNPQETSANGNLGATSNGSPTDILKCYGR